jgi:hypothetical protein
MKTMFKVLYQTAKEDPKEFWGSLVFLVGLFVMFWATLWLEAICQGRV